MSKIVVIRIAGQVRNRKKDEETLRRLKLEKKFTTTVVEEDDSVRMGMVKAVSHMVAYGKIDDALLKDLESKRPAKEGVHFLHPPRGGFKKSSKLSYPKGILGKNLEISKLLSRML